MTSFAYEAPARVDEALALLREHGDAAKVLAGGQSLVPLLNYRLAMPRIVVDVNRLPLDGLEVGGGRLRIGALVRHHRLEESGEIARHCPILRDAVALVGNVRVRSLGTVGGSLAHADPAAELPMMALALDGRCTLAGSGGSRVVEVREFVTGPLTTVLRPDELLTEIDLATVGARGWAVEEIARRAGDFAIVAVAALLGLDARGRATDVRIALGGVGPVPVRAMAAEEALTGHEPTAERLAHCAAIARDALEPASDGFVSAAYRRHLAGVLVRRALSRATTRAMAA